MVSPSDSGQPARRVRAALLDADRLLRAVASGRQRGSSPPYRRVELRYVELKAGRRLSLTSYDDTQALTRNLACGADAQQAVDDLLGAGYGSWHVETVGETLQYRLTKKGRPLLHVARTGDGEREVDRGHDRAKRRRLEAADPVFAALGITTGDGVVKPSRTAKFRQVQDLLGALDPVVDEAVSRGPGEALGHDRPLRVVDLGCGNAYLTFAAHRYLTAVRGVPTAVVGVDVKAQALAHNTDVARRLGVAERVAFRKGTIGDVDLAEPPDVVLALHACDTATDSALARAVEWRSAVVLAAPCCHHDVAAQLAAERADGPGRLVTRHGILRERLADVLTDAMRAALLRIVGYRVDVVEFVDPEHTPRNTLLRAVRTGAAAPPDVVADYRALTAEWGVTPALETMLRATGAGLPEPAE